MGFLLGFLAGTFSRELIVRLGLEELFESKTFKTLLKLKRLGNSVLSGNLDNVINSYIRQLTPIQLRELQGNVNKLVRNTRVKELLLKHSGIDARLKQANPFSNISKHTKKVQEDYLKTISKEQLEKTDVRISLHGEAFDWGIFFPLYQTANKSWVGNALLKFQTGTKQYIYFNFSYKVWEDMVSSQHAGSVFWNEYNFAFRGGSVSNKIKQVIKKLNTKNTNKKLIYKTRLKNIKTTKGTK